jgi:hypothetical protein
VQVAPVAVDVDHLAEEQRTAVAEARREAAELVAGVGLRDRRRALGHGVPGEKRDTLGRPEGFGLGAQLGGQGVVEREQLRLGRRSGAPRLAQLLQLPGVGVFQLEQRRAATLITSG